MATELLSLFAKIGIDDKEYNKGIEGAESKASKLGKGMKTAFKVGAAAVGVTAGAIAGLSKKLTDGVKATAEYGDNVDKMSQKMGISSKAYQEWDAVMKHSGTTIDALKPSMKTLATQAEKNSSVFQKLGISQEEVAKLSQEDLFAKTIEGLQNMEEGTERTALTSQLLGRGATELGALLNTSAEETQAMKDRVNELGGVMGEDAVKAAAAFQDQLQDMQTSFDGLKRNLLGDFMPAFTDAMGGLTEIFSGNTDKGIEQLSKGIEDIVSKLIEKLPTILNIGSNIILAISDSVISNLPQIATAAVSTMITFGKGLIEQLPLLLQAGISIFLALVQGITENVGELIPAVVSVIDKIATILTDPTTLSNILNSAVALIMALANGLVENLPVIIPTLVTVIGVLATMLTSPEMLVQLVSAALELVIALARGLVKAIPQLMRAATTIITNLVTAIVKLAPKLLSAAGKLMSSFIKGLRASFSSLGKAGSQIVSEIGKAIGSVINKAKEWGSHLIQNFIDGIKAKFQAVKDSFSSIAGLAKKLLGHSTPDEGPMKDDDKWMPDFMDNLASGIKLNKYKVTNAIDDLAGDMVLDGGYDYGYETMNDTQQFEFTFAEGNAPLLQIARLLFPYMKVVSKEKGGAY